MRFRATVQSREVSQSVELLRTSDLSKLPKGQAFALLDGNNLYKLRIPLLQYDAREAVPNDIAAVARAMEKNYSNSPTNTDWPDTRNTCAKMTSSPTAPTAACRTCAITTCANWTATPSCKDRRR